MADTRGFTPRQVDDLEMWECAVLLGIEAEPGADDLMAQRIAAQRDGAPMPDVPPTAPDVMASLPPV
jgi:hypothetical protein